jgi:hypothetical protein
MKVIASLGDGKVLCEVTTQELAHLNGLTSTYDSNWNQSFASIGAVVEVDKAVKILNTVRSFDKEQLKRIASYLEDSTKIIKQVQEVTTALTLFDTLASDIK